MNATFLSEAALVFMRDMFLVELNSELGFYNVFIDFVNNR